MIAMHAVPSLLLGGRVPNQEAIALSPTVGWWVLAGAVALSCVFLLQSERWRRWWLTTEDPRTVGLFRIVFGFFVIANVNGMWEFFTYLFTDEGIFTADVARQVFASHQFAGFGDGLADDEPWGFFDFDAVLQFLAGPKYSLLYFWDSPTFFWGHLIAFEVVAVMFMGTSITLALYSNQSMMASGDVDSELDKIGTDGKAAVPEVGPVPEAPEGDPSTPE